MNDQFVLFPTAKQVCTCCKAIRFCKNCCCKCDRWDSCNSTHYDTCNLRIETAVSNQEWINSLLVVFGGWKMIEDMANEII